MEKRDFERCQLCGTVLGKIEFDSPIYCDRCISEMLRKNLTPNQYQEKLMERRGK